MKYVTLVACVCVWAGCSHSTQQNTNPDSDGKKTFDPCAADPKAGYDPASKGLAKCCDVGPAHCVPSSDVQDKLASSLDPCPDGTSVCMPDPIIMGGGLYKPPACTSSVGSAPGVCLSQCIPLVSKNPQSALLGQDGCGDGDLCVPCLNPLDGKSTGACDLTELLCSTGDGGSGDGGDGGGPACPYTGPPLIDPTTLPACSPECGGAHCLPAALVPMAQQSLLSGCTDASGGAGFCTPDDLISTGGNFIPKSCTSVAGAEGRCLSVCLPSVASKATLLPVDVCDSGQKCVPCYDPTATDPATPTGACTLACDKPSQPPVVLTCPWTGPNVVEPTQFAACDDSCYGAHCVPKTLVPSTVSSLLAECGGGSGFCTPDSLVASAGNTPPKTCRSIGGSEGRCLSTCIPSIAAQATALPVDTCGMGEVCAPCFDPTQPSPQPATGACTLACDQPTEGPLEIVCPYTGPNIIDPTKFASCASATCQNAHCLPEAYVPVAQRGLLAACPGGGLCAPDPIIGSINNFVPKTCASVAGVEGRCVSTCLPSVEAQADLLPTAGCEDQPGTVCAPCYDPTSVNWMVPTGACSIGCDAPMVSPAPIMCPYSGPPVVDVTKFPSCASGTCSNAHCVPAALIPVAQQSLLSPCPTGLCAPDKIIASANNYVPPTCTSIAGVEGRCVSTCLPSVQAEAVVLPTAGCAAGEVCAPCYDPTAPSPAPPTGACSIGCDKPGPSPAPIACPYNGANIINPSLFPSCASGSCTNAHCLPAAFVPASQQALLTPCAGGGYCTPDTIIGSANHFVPPTCTSIAGAEGRCVSKCLPSVAAIANILPTAGCASGTVCAPCYDPTSATPNTQTGACQLGCDKPAQPPLVLTCPWTTPVVIDPTPLPGCSCNGAHCLPSALVSSAQQPLLNGCDSDPNTGGTQAGFCVPDPLITSGGKIDPTNCQPFAGTASTTADGRCLSRCIKAVATQPSLETGACTGTGHVNEACVPCWDPVSGLSTGACGSLGCDQTAPANKFLFPRCCTNTGTCVPGTQLSTSQKNNLGQRDCPSATYYCAPTDHIPGSGVAPQNCHVSISIVPPFTWDSQCVSDCIIGGAAALLPRAGCPVNWSCPPP